ncbi:hypothetical protein B841_05155 [Corynebacterium maris DSM 45190]|uniref:Uncharacterized protein n=1 Tax=Corynebacterium maris DSM 45190 TaxID=1224163 RepID=S5STP1_9CORY|nr:hypothetical protein [Corynebacterium maris]AGS34504.1 hypothetical protein B841_05155 [Corynebacterium maris DSM 45190]
MTEANRSNPNPAEPDHRDENDAQDAPKSPDQNVDDVAAAKKAEADNANPSPKKEDAGTLDNDDLADEQGEESFPASDAPGNY